MSDEHERLRKTLDHLQSQLDAIRVSHPAVVESLEPMIVEAKALASGSPAEAPHATSMLARLRDEVLKYEALHPSLAGNLGSIIDALGRMGI